MKPGEEWQPVPAAIRGNTVTALVNRGVLEHKKSTTYFGEWVTWGRIRRVTHNTQAQTRAEDQL